MPSKISIFRRLPLPALVELGWASNRVESAQLVELLGPSLGIKIIPIITYRRTFLTYARVMIELTVDQEFKKTASFIDKKDNIQTVCSGW